MTTIVGDYKVLLDKPVHLSAQHNSSHPRSQFCRFDLASNFSPEVSPVLLFRTTVMDKDTRVRVFVNPEPSNNNSDGFPSDEDYVTKLSKGYFGLHMETLPAGKFKKGQENKVVFTISGDGTKFGDVIIGDVLLQYQRTV
jgi:hypothetical protein